MVITKEAIIAIAVIISGFYITCLFAFLSQLKDIRKNSDQYLITALERLRNLLKPPEIPPEVTDAYSKLVEAYKS